MFGSCFGAPFRVGYLVFEHVEHVNKLTTLILRRLDKAQYFLSVLPKLRGSAGMTA